MSLLAKFKELFGVNLKSMTCPNCGTPQPKVRKPKNMREVLWGGCTCDKCGCEMDKWGKKIKS